MAQGLQEKVTVSEIERIKQALEDATKEEMDKCPETFIQQLVSLSLTIMKKVKSSKHYDN